MITYNGIEIPVGHTLSDEVDTYMAVRPRECSICAFEKMNSCISICCLPEERTDMTGVHFIKLKDLED